jgi:tRNA G10  N-methylase Trm11
VNDLDMSQWRDHGDIVTDSLWIIDRRDNSGSHTGAYWGNFVPQIPRQMMMRYTRVGEWVLDPFVGGGTTLIESRRLGRNGIGVEIDPRVASLASGIIASEECATGAIADVVNADSRQVDFTALLHERGAATAQLVILHPPYHDIIRFSEQPGDLSATVTVEEFLAAFGEVVDRVTPALDSGRYCVVVIGDKYARGEWVPLGFYCLNEMLKRGYLLKSIVVKNFDETRAKRSHRSLWRYRALAGGFYVFKHEYVLILKKR